MRKILFLSYVVWLLVALTGCNHEADALLERAEGFLPAQQDSAELCLNSIEQPQQLNDAQRALYGLLRTIVDNRRGNAIESDSLIKESYDYFLDASDEGQTSDPKLLRRYAQICYYMACYYSFCDSTQLCEQLLKQSVQCSERCEDWHTCYVAYTELAMVSRMNDPEYATQQALKALQIYQKVKDDKENEVLILGEIAACYLSAEDAENALQYYHQGYELAEKTKFHDSKNELCTGIATSYLYLGDYWRALQYAKLAMETADSVALVPTKQVLAQCYFACDSLDQAKEVLVTIPCDSDDYVSKYLKFRDLSEIAIQKKDFDSLYAYVDSAYECLENRFSHAQREMEVTQTDSITKVVESEQVQEESERNKGLWIAIGLCLLLIAALIIYGVMKYRKRDEADQLKELQLQQQVIQKNALNQTLLQKHLLEKLEHISQFPENERERVAEATWHEYERLINDSDDNFVQRLRQQHTEFKEADIQLCMLVRQKVINAVIGNIYGISDSAVKKRKSTLKKKGFQITDPTITLEQVVEQL